MELKGTGVSPGIAMGPALVVERDAAPIFRLNVPPEGVEAEVADRHLRGGDGPCVRDLLRETGPRRRQDLRLPDGSGGDPEQRDGRNRNRDDSPGWREILHDRRPKLSSSAGASLGDFSRSHARLRGRRVAGLKRFGF